NKIRYITGYGIRQVAGNWPSDEYHFIGLLIMNVHVRGGIIRVNCISEREHYFISCLLLKHFRL
ncbi:hypothetical protein ACNCL9_005656, partial [Escherichia coli]